MPRLKSTPVRTHQAEAPTTAVARADSADPASENAPITIRVRHANGCDRFSVRPSQTVGDVRRLVGDLTKIEPLKRVLLFRDMACTEALDDDDEILGPAGLALEHGEMLSMKEKPKAERKKKADTDGDGGTAKRPKGAMAKAGGEYLREGKTPRDVAIAFMTPDTSRMGEVAYSQMSAAARLDAVATNRVQVEKLEAQRKGAQPTLRINFTGNRKAFEESAPSYTEHELVATICEIMSRQTTRSRQTAVSASHLLNAEQIARRSPAMFWSVYALGEQAGETWDARLQRVVDLASEALAS